jgi:hypothetical protein
MTGDAERVNGWVCPRCERKNPLRGDGRCQTPRCIGIHSVLKKQAEEFPPDIQEVVQWF